MSRFQNCLMKMLDGDELRIKLNVETTYGVTLFDKVCQHIKLAEKDYFSLRYVHPKDKLFSWIDFRKTLKKQLKEGPYSFYFCVKFFPPDPTSIQEDFTRYLFVLALRDMMFIGKLPCSFHYELLLSSFIVQAEFGDQREELLRRGYLDTVKFMPKQPKNFRELLIEYHSKLKGLSSEEVEVQYLKYVKDLELYGVELHDIKGKDSRNMMIGVSYRGLTIFEDQQEQFKICWPEMISASFFKKNISIKTLLPERTHKTFSYKCASRASTKRLYRSIVDFHTFFRRPLPLPPRSGLSLSSRFRYNGRKTYLQIKKNIPSLATEGDSFNPLDIKTDRIIDESPDQSPSIAVTINEDDNWSAEHDEYYMDDERNGDLESIEIIESPHEEYETQMFEAKIDKNGRILANTILFKRDIIGDFAKRALTTNLGGVMEETRMI